MLEPGDFPPYPMARSLVDLAGFKLPKRYAVFNGTHHHAQIAADAFLLDHLEMPLPVFDIG